MKILVTGATGYLGSNITRTLLKNGYEVVIVKRSNSNIDRISDCLSRVKTFDIDRCNPENIFQDNGGIDIVLHAATCYGRKGEKNNEIMNSNILFPLCLLEAAIANKVGTFINIDSSLNKFTNPYSLSKNHFLEWGEFLSSQNEIKFINLKLEHFYGPGDDDSKFVSYIVRNCLRNVPELKLTKGEQLRDFIYIDDVVSAFLVLLNNLEHLTQNNIEFELGSGCTLSIRELVEKVQAITESKTLLNFGALPYRKKEVMESNVNIEPLIKLGWSCKIGIEEGIRAIIRKEKGEIYDS